VARVGARLHPEDRPSLGLMLERARRGDSEIDLRFRLRMPDRSIRWLHLVAHGYRDGDGHVEYIGAARDVTQLVMSRAELGEARLQLAQLARVVGLGPVAAAIAHEISQPLAGIVINASAGLRMLNATPPDVEGARETMHRTLRDSGRTAEIVARVRAHFTKKDPKVEGVDLNVAVRSTVALAIRELQLDAVDPVMELEQGLPLVAGNAVELQQVIMNLLRNAADAMHCVSTQHRRLVVRAVRQGGDQVRVSVQDNGVGLETLASERLFHPFYSTKSEGMGIGLAISRSIIEGYGGRIWAESNDGPGATFAFILPQIADCVCLSGGTS
jgi:C4-dicarboxylate-specific signal transduction histidine kinase